MGKQRKTLARLGLAFVLAVGFALVWGAAAGWSVSVLHYATAPNWSYENLEVRNDGTPIVFHRSPRFPYDVEYRTLDGRPILSGTLPGRSWLVAARCRKGRPARRRLAWDLRIIARSDSRRPPTYWYLIHDGDPKGRAYFVGYDRNTKQCVGYIGRRGFSRTPPTEEECFAVPVTTGGVHDVVTTSRQVYVPRLTEPSTHFSPLDPGRIPAWRIYLATSDGLLEVDLQRRAVRKLLQDDGIISAGIGQGPWSEAASASTASADREFLAVRCVDRVVFLGPEGQPMKTVPLPKPCQRAEEMNIRCLPAGGVIVDAAWPDRSTGLVRHELYWMQEGGEVVRNETAVLRRFAPPRPLFLAAGLCASLPVPAFLAGWVTVLDPLNYLGSGETGYRAALARSLSYFWPGLAVVVAVSAWLAGLAYRRQNRYAAGSPWLWAVFVFLLGLPGFVGYRFGRHWPTLETCPECQRSVPRDRLTCTACNQTFHAPAPTGTEIFA
ncbi:MAG: hypothetical protein GXP27_21100 [Planctomycetes bacterium]|nr:hypothetical protein [Planctomycetota bacterium]